MSNIRRRLFGNVERHYLTLSSDSFSYYYDQSGTGSVNVLYDGALLKVNTSEITITYTNNNIYNINYSKSTGAITFSYSLNSTYEDRDTVVTVSYDSKTVQFTVYLTGRPKLYFDSSGNNILYYYVGAAGGNFCSTQLYYMGTPVNSGVTLRKYGDLPISSYYFSDGHIYASTSNINESIYSDIRAFIEVTYNGETAELCCILDKNVRHTSVTITSFTIENIYLRHEYDFPANANSSLFDSINTMNISVTYNYEWYEEAYPEEITSETGTYNNSVGGNINLFDYRMTVLNGYMNDSISQGFTIENEYFVIGITADNITTLGWQTVDFYFSIGNCDSTTYPIYMYCGSDGWYCENDIEISSISS